MTSRVSALHYGVTWLDQHPMAWLPGSFPVIKSDGDWTLTLTEESLTARPTRDITSEAEAKDELGPMLESWSAMLEVSERLIVSFNFQTADFDYAEGDLQRSAADSAGSSDDASVLIMRPGPIPDFTWQDTEAARATRMNCLRPLRQGTRPLSDAAYWLCTYLAHWAGSEKDAAQRLKVTNSVVAKLHKLAGWSEDRKVGKDSFALDSDDTRFLTNAVEELIRRLHLVESGLDPGGQIDVGQLKS